MKYSKFFKIIEKKDHLINKLPNLSDEQKQLTIDFFTKHPNYESEVDWNRKDLTWDDFEEVINKERISKSQLKNFVKEGKQYLRLYTSKNLIIYQPLTYMGSRYLASTDVAPKIEGKWCISYQKNRRYWDEYSFDKKKVFLILCTNTTKFALEISQKGSVNYWDSKDNKITKTEFKKRVISEIPNINDILKEFIPIVINNFGLIQTLLNKDINDTKTFEESRRISEEMKFKSFPKSFKRQVAKKGFYEWDGDLTFFDLKRLGLVSEDRKHLDEKVKYFKVKGTFDLINSKIEEVVWPLEIESGKFIIACNNSLKKLAIPNNFTSIDETAFYGCSALESVTIPNSVTKIGFCAFNGCSSLTEITIPDSITSIGESAFKGCSSLTEITIPDSITSIGDSTFDRCTSLTEITIPDGVTSIGNYAFYDCSSLTEISIPDSVTSIGNSAFEDCSSLESIVIPNSVESIGDYAFFYCISLKAIYIDKPKDSLDIKNIFIKNTPNTQAYNTQVYWRGEF